MVNGRVLDNHLSKNDQLIGRLWSTITKGRHREGFPYWPIAILTLMLTPTSPNPNP